jgi:hypothetical protein
MKTFAAIPLEDYINAAVDGEPIKLGVVSETSFRTAWDQFLTLLATRESWGAHMSNPTTGVIGFPSGGSIEIRVVEARDLFPTMVAGMIGVPSPLPHTKRGE